MSDTVRRFSIPVKEAPTSSVPSFRDRIAGRSAEFDGKFPRAVDLESRVLSSMHSVLYGVASLVCGIHSEKRFPEMILGYRHLPVADLCRLITDPRREAKDAAFAAVSELAMALGYRLVPMEPATIDLHEGMAGVVETTGDLLAGISRDLKDDGVQDPEEARRRLPQVDLAQRHLSRLATTVARTAAS